MDEVYGIYSLKFFEQCPFAGQPAQPNQLHCVEQAGKSTASPGQWMTMDCSMAMPFICNINL